jgi:16S rRNA (uracil1498-N3)-methyltransferase
VTAAGLRSSVAHVFVPSLEHPVLDDGDLHHLRRVLRVRDDDPVSASDGAGRWCVGRLRGDAFVADGGIETTAGRQLLTVATAIPKGDRVEWMVQKLTEVGVGRIVLVEFERSAVRWSDERAAKQRARLERIVREAAMQSRRVELPSIEGPVPFATVVSSSASDLVLADPDGAPAWSHGAPGWPWTTVVIGPEGGLTPAELDCGAPTVSLSEHVLRVETAAVAAAVVAAALIANSSTADGM